MNIKKQIATAVATLALGAALIGGGTFAYFNSTVSNIGNTFATGTIDIASGYSDAKFNFGPAKPGDLFSGTYHIKNTGSLPANLTVNFGASQAPAPDSDPLTRDELANELYIDTITFNGQDIKGLITNSDGNSSVTTISELKSTGTLNLGPIAAGMTTPQDLVISGHFFNDTVSQNLLQGKTLTATLDFEARQ